MSVAVLASVWSGGREGVSERGMRTMRRWLAVAVLLFGVGSLFAQAPKGSGDSFVSPLPDPLPDLPQPLDAPRSLYIPPAPPGPAAPVPERRYFEQDPLLDPPDMPQAGWFADAEIDPEHAHFKNRLMETVPIGTAPPTTVHPAGADLNWTVSPRLEVGYRLPSGFGEFSLGFRSLNSSGSQQVVNTDGPASANSSIELYQFDFDYASREYSLWPCWKMKWFIGGRVAWTYYDASNAESAATAAAGSGLINQKATNYFNGFGPHAGFELSRHIKDTGWSVTMKVDGAGMIGWLGQSFFATDTTGATAQVRDTAIQDIPMLHGEIGLSWESCWRSYRTHVFVGYEYEYWWDVGGVDAARSQGDMSNQGLVLRAGFNY